MNETLPNSRSPDPESSGKTIRRKDRALSEKSAREILSKGEYGVLSMTGTSGNPYGVPLNYCLIKDTLYFHCALEGRKVDLLRQNPRVSFTVVGSTEIQPSAFTTAYESCLVEGTSYEAEGQEKDQALRGLIEKYSPGYRQAGEITIQKYRSKTLVFGIVIQRISGKANRIHSD